MNGEAIVNKHKYGAYKEKKVVSCCRHYLYKDVGTSNVICPSGLGY